MSYDTNAKPRYRKNNDPAYYGFICPSCDRRYGAPQALDCIDIKRCETCPTFASEYLQGEKVSREVKQARMGPRGPYREKVKKLKNLSPEQRRALERL